MKRPALNLFGMYVLQSGFTFLYILLLSQIGEQMAAKLRQDLFKQIIIQDLSFFDENRTGELVNRLTADVQDFKSCFKQCVSQGLRSIAQLIGKIQQQFFAKYFANIFLLVINFNSFHLFRWRHLIIYYITKTCHIGTRFSANRCCGYVDIGWWTTITQQKVTSSSRKSNGSLRRGLIKYPYRSIECMRICRNRNVSERNGCSSKTIRTARRWNCRFSGINKLIFKWVIFWLL